MKDRGIVYLYIYAGEMRIYKIAKELCEYEGIKYYRYLRIKKKFGTYAGEGKVVIPMRLR